MERPIGFIGLGAMGMPMARRLAGAGYRLVVYDADPAALEAAGGVAGIEAADGVGAVVDGVGEVVLTCLPNPGAVEAVYGGIARAGLLCCDCSTVGPALAVRLHGRLRGLGSRYVECPVLGGADEAAAGRLFAVLSGAAEDVERLAPLLNVLARDRRHVGGPGDASRIKVVQNGLGLVQLAAIAEALAIVAKAGGDLATFVEVVGIGGGMADTPLFRAKAPPMLDPDAPSKGRLRIGAKDIGLARALAGEVGVEAPLFAEAERVFAAAMAAGLGEDDVAAVARVVEKRAGVSLLRGRAG
jgi:3-hydroxyisobutyrate dehydrogenase-like beta-hydroxyacid dehydrogenase